MVLIKKNTLDIDMKADYQEFEGLLGCILFRFSRILFFGVKFSTKISMAGLQFVNQLDRPAILEYDSFL